MRDIDITRDRRMRLLMVAGIGAAILVTMWMYAASLEHWSDAQSTLFMVGPIVLGAVSLGALVTLVSDLVHQRRG